MKIRYILFIGDKRSATFLDRNRGILQTFFRTFNLKDSGYCLFIAGNKILLVATITFNIINFSGDSENRVTNAKVRNFFHFKGCIFPC